MGLVSYLKGLFVKPKPKERPLPRSLFPPTRMNRFSSAPAPTTRQESKRRIDSSESSSRSNDTSWDYLYNQSTPSSYTDDDRPSYNSDRSYDDDRSSGFSFGGGSFGGGGGGDDYSSGSSDSSSYDSGSSDSGSSSWDD